MKHFYSPNVKPLGSKMCKMRNKLNLYCIVDVIVLFYLFNDAFADSYAW